MISCSAIQYSCNTNKRENSEKAEHFIRASAADGASIIALQELYNTTYFCREIDQKYFDWSEPIPGPTTERFSALAAELGVVLLIPFFEKHAPGVYYNSMVVFNVDGSILGKYRKMHIPDDPGFYEKYYFTPGDKGFTVFDTPFGRIGTLICWDQWFPEAARMAALQGAEILFYPTAIGTLPEETDLDKAQFLDAWKTIQKSHAITNGCFVVSINRTGEEGGTRFWGNSFITGPFGEELAIAGEDEGFILADIDLTSIEKHRQTWPFFRDRRIDAYKHLNKRFMDL